MKTIRFFAFGFFAGLLLVLALFVVVVNFCGRGITDQTWFLDMYPLKQCMAENKQGGKIIIIGGSSSLFGIDGKKLQEYTGMDNINLSMSIMMPMRFYLTDLEKNVKENDIVVLSLELTNQYWDTGDGNFSNFGVSLLFGCNPETQKTLSFGELCSLYFQYGFSWVNTSLFHKDGTLLRLFGDKSRQGVFDGVYRREYVYANWKKARMEGKKNEFGYCSGLSEYGDWIVKRKSKDTDIAPFQLGFSFGSEFLSNYERIRKLTAERGAQLLLVWPNIYFYAEQSGFAEFKKHLQDEGIMIHGRPEAMSIPKKFYFDPIHHVNSHGAELWTYEFAKTICKATGCPLKKSNPAWPYVVFADMPSRCFPGTKEELYDTGVRLNRKEFSFVLNIPENLRGKNLALNLIACPDRKTSPVFAKIQVDGRICKVEEHQYQERMEADILVPADSTGHESIMLTCAINGNSIGLERLFMEEGSVIYDANNSSVFSYLKGFSSQEDWGRWTDSPHAEFSFYLPKKYRKKDLILTLDALTFVHPKRPVCKFRILSENGKVLFQTESTRFSGSYRFKVPQEFTGDRQLKLMIEVENPRSGKELGISEDPRKLGFGLRSVRMEGPEQ